MLLRIVMKRLSNENFNKNKLIHELYLTERQMKKLIKKN